MGFHVLTRQKIILYLLHRVSGALSPTSLMKLAFLLRHETVLSADPSFYDFVPYKYGPFSFTMYRDLSDLRERGYLAACRDVELAASAATLDHDSTGDLPVRTKLAVEDVLARYGQMDQSSLVRDVYRRYPWFAVNSILPERADIPVVRPRQAPCAVYTCGYQGRSVDAFFNLLLTRGIEVVLDVRRNAISRKYGFSGRRLAELCGKLGLKYQHLPSLGIPSSERAGLSDLASYQRLLDWYERTVLPDRTAQVNALAHLMSQQPAVLVCVERHADCCHRGRLAGSVSIASGLAVVHL